MKRHQGCIARRAGLGLCAALISGALPAWAQPSAADKATAEALFDAALDLMRKGRNEEACPRLEQSHRIDPGIGTLLYLAECYEKTGRTASADPLQLSVYRLAWAELLGVDPDLVSAAFCFVRLDEVVRYGPDQLLSRAELEDVLARPSVER